MATTFTPNIKNVLGQNNNFMTPITSSPYQALGAWEKEGGLPSIYDEYAKATNIAGGWVDETYNPIDPYKTEGLLGNVRHVVGSSMAKDQLQNLLADYVDPGSPLAEKLTYGLGMAQTYGEELADAFRIGKDTIKAGDWDKIWSGEFLTHPLEDIKANRIGLSIPYGSTELERLSKVPGIKSDPRFQRLKLRQRQLMNQRKQQMQETIRQAEAKAKADAAAAEQNRLAQSRRVILDPGSGGGGGGGTWHQQTKAKEKAGQKVAGPGFGKGAYFRDGGLINFYRYGGFI